MVQFVPSPSLVSNVVYVAYMQRMVYLGIAERSEQSPFYKIITFESVIHALNTLA